MDSRGLHQERAATMDDALSRPAWEFMVFRNPDLPGEPECLVINLPGLGWSLKPPADLRQGSGLTLGQLNALLKTERARNPGILIRTTPMVFEYLRDWYLMRGGDWRAMTGVWQVYSGWPLNPSPPTPPDQLRDYGSHASSHVSGFGY